MGAAFVSQQYLQIVDAAKPSFLAGADWAYATGMIAVLLGGVLVLFLSPRKEHEQRLLAEYQAEEARDQRASRSSD